MTLKAVFVGISYKGTQSQLNGCIHDLEDLYFYVKAQKPLVETRILCDNVTALPVSGLPTRANIIENIKWLVAGATATSRLFFSYSGHGSNTRDRSGDELDGKDETIVPCDYETKGQISDDELRSLLVDTLPEGCRLTMICDSCHSGTILDLPHNFLDESASLAAKNIKYELNPKNKATKAQVFCLSGCRDPQTSADAFINGKYSGAMTHAFLEFNDPKKPNGNVPNETLADKLVKINLWLKSNSYTQKPQLSLGNSANANVAWHIFE